MATPPKVPMGKHFQNDQRRHNENEAESHLKRGSVRTEQTETEEEDAEECPGAVGGQGLSLPPPSNVVSRSRQHTGSARSPVDSFGQPPGRLMPPFDMPPLNNGQIGMNEVNHLGLPEPAGINRKFLIDLQRFPEHLRRQQIFNHWPHQRTVMTDGATSEDQQYQIEQKKQKARLILTHVSDNIRSQMNLIMDEKVIEMILESLEGMFQ
ncbi:uncharacterized protein LOC128558530 [Mercenaria mercenaria]|uniref:uncharacterized protein LOC128558530 n=1 Tax=Mercenaria mercenaria TaxID=6596 RepID=UPI00234F6127|nr:uncharacterized protein LOC128558530 [Mercenaria mercenaria]XP_053404094.1 uncharacterized protein LOC128558530 [Mercenaria mercenaria]XP_053404095.1 uncharacterized protein LOC128558530 [Mercenaria mercenaria]